MRKRKNRELNVEESVIKKLNELAFIFFCRTYNMNIRERVLESIRYKTDRMKELQKELTELIPEYCKLKEIPSEELNIEFSGASIYLWVNGGKKMNRIDSTLVSTNDKLISKWWTGNKLSTLDFMNAIKQMETKWKEENSL